MIDDMACPNCSDGRAKLLPVVGDREDYDCPRCGTLHQRERQPDTGEQLPRGAGQECRWQGVAEACRITGSEILASGRHRASVRAGIAHRVRGDRQSAMAGWS